MTYNRILLIFLAFIFISTASFCDEGDTADLDLFNELTPETATASPVVSDPFSGYNRVMTHFNDVTFRYLLFPMARGYNYVVPRPVRTGVSNVFRNSTFPIRFANSILQLKFKYASEETARFVINTTLGVFGIFDPATHLLQLKTHNEDLGQTLGRLGIGPGPYIVLPILGPSNLRDVVGTIGDSFLDPINYTNNVSDNLSFRMAYGTNQASLNLNQYDTLKSASLDFYSFLRDGYDQRRKRQIVE